MSEEGPASSRLCGQCGLCCNGVMFHTVRLQPGDSAPALVALGLRLKRKKKRYYFAQPCPAFRGNCCAIYQQRPERCRLFACRQLERVNAGTITEAMALDRIRDVQRRVQELSAMIDHAGATDARKPLAKRYEKVTAEPVDPADQEGSTLRLRLTTAMQELDAILDEEFRVEPASASAPDHGDGSR